SGRSASCWPACCAAACDEPSATSTAAAITCKPCPRSINLSFIDSSPQSKRRNVENHVVRARTARRDMTGECNPCATTGVLGIGIHPLLRVLNRLRRNPFEQEADERRRRHSGCDG